MYQKKAISPIISIIIILLITIAIAGAGYSYLSAYWSGLTGREIQVLDAICYSGNQGKITVKNIGTSSLNTGNISVTDAQTGQDISQDVFWTSSVDDPNLVLQLRFEEGSGTLARDTSGQGNDGTLGGNPQWVEGKVGGALSFDGDGDYVEVPYFTELGQDVNRSISLWVKAASGQPYEYPRFFGGNRNLYMYVNGHGNSGSDTHFCIYDGVNSGVAPVLNDLIFTDIWHNIVMTVDRDANEIKVYVDGEVGGTDSDISDVGNTSNTGDIYFGSYGGQFLDGTIDEVRIYNRVLEEDDIKALAENSVPVQPGETATLTHTCSGLCSYSLVLPGGAKEAMLEC